MIEINSNGPRTRSRAVWRLAAIWDMLPASANASGRTLMLLESAALLVWRSGPSGPEFLLAHPGGPYWRTKDDGAWTIPKGLVEADEDSAAAARREFSEETGLVAPASLLPLTPRQVTRSKRVTPWLAEADLDLSPFVSQTIEIAWPPRSGRRQIIPEVDRIAYFAATEASRKVIRGQAPILVEALERIARDLAPS